MYKRQLVDISKNPKFSELFYEIRHKTYSNAWDIYRDQLWSDIAEQVFTTVTASVIAGIVEAVLWATVVLAPGAHAAGIAAYFGVYTLLTKYFIDVKVHESKSKVSSQTFYPTDKEKKDPHSLNERMCLDRILKDSMAAALLAHPGGYYRTVSGGTPEDRYTAEVLVSPPNGDRIYRSASGFLDLLWENLWDMGESNPDVYTALDFDELNLDYFLLVNELFAINGRTDKVDYSFSLINANSGTYKDYQQNSLGALQDMVNLASNGNLNAIRPTNIDGRPEYEFIDKDKSILPLSALNRPIILSERRYSQITPMKGHLTINVQCNGDRNTKGINAYDMNHIESQFYKAKLSINENGFDYPITAIYVDIIQEDQVNGIHYRAQGIEISNSDYLLDDGNLYFTRSIETILFEKYYNLRNILNERTIIGTRGKKLYYKVHILFDLVVEDTTELTNRLALAQATTYSIMDL